MPKNLKGRQSTWRIKPLAQVGTLPADQVEKARKAIPLGKVGRADDIANAVLFFTSSGMVGHISGQVLSVSGGYATPG
jgi:NAD(P)-dependent dehydrogenase (short-subunit alcohol dehydrogenase family)